MPYLGTPPQSGFITTAKQRVTSSTNNYVDLDHAISSIADVIVFVNFVKQDTTNLTLTTSTRITLGATLVSSDIVEIHYLGKAVNTQTPSTGTVTLDMLSASGTKSSSTFLRGDNTFASAGLSNWSENSGNLLPSNSSYGVYLGVNSATASNLLDDYEEGNFTPTIGSLSLAAATGKYTKIGRAVSVQGYVSMGSQSGGTTTIVGGFPFQPASNSYLDVTGNYSNQNSQALRMQGGTSNASLVSKTIHSDNNNSDYNYNDMNGKYFYFHGVYFV